VKLIRVLTAVADEKSQAQKSETETSKDETPKAQSSSESVESEANKSVTGCCSMRSHKPKKRCQQRHLRDENSQKAQKVKVTVDSRLLARKVCTAFHLKEGGFTLAWSCAGT